MLAHNITANGAVVIPAGTKFTGVVVTARRTVSSAQRLTVDVTGIDLGGRRVVVTTTGAQRLDNNVRTKRGTPVSRANYTVAVGRRLQFRLARPITL